MWSFIVKYPISGYAYAGRRIFNVHVSDEEAATKKLYDHLVRDTRFAPYLRGVDAESFLDGVLDESGELSLSSGVSVHIIHREDVIEL